ncbi:hypothetical protein CDAR_203971 [Caerostris darwini]|uniref:Uncharacterized protein n=1 Tax=Caerostris darwini TaxID=1538125 RepID=A0AAV4RP20_9ARAC|nr:hypothetical protein CDAR_203971 [Caerostris darwini]
MAHYSEVCALWPAQEESKRSCFRSRDLSPVSHSVLIEFSEVVFNYHRQRCLIEGAPVINSEPRPFQTERSLNIRSTIVYLVPPCFVKSLG